MPRTLTTLLFRLSWRNLWRNKKRTLIASASVFFALVLSVAMLSIKNGQFEYMIHSAVSLTTGHIQVHAKGYWEKRSLDESMMLDSSFLARAGLLPHVLRAVPRFESFALVSHGPITKVSAVNGIDRERENAMTGLGNRIVRGIPLSDWNGGIVVAEGLAKLLRADVGDSLVLYGQGYQGMTAAAVLPIVAVARFPVLEMNNATLYLPLEVAQELYAAPGRVTAIAFLMQSDEEVGTTAAKLQAMAGSTCEVMTWREMLPELLQAIAVSRGAATIMSLILYVVVGFGIFGTVVMMTAERMREFGITIAVGMNRWRLAMVTVIEAILISMLGACTGLAGAVPLMYYLSIHPIPLSGDAARTMIAFGLEPIIPVSLDPSIFITQAVIVFLIGAVSGLYPVSVLRKLQPGRAMRG